MMQIRDNHLSGMRDLICPTQELFVETRLPENFTGLHYYHQPRLLSWRGSEEALTLWDIKGKEAVPKKSDDDSTRQEQNNPGCCCWRRGCAQKLQRSKRLNER